VVGTVGAGNGTAYRRRARARSTSPRQLTAARLSCERWPLFCHDPYEELQ
jgi:hypothetical protein